MYTSLIYVVGSTRFIVSAHEGFYSVGISDRTTGERGTYTMDSYDTLCRFLGPVLRREPYMKMEVAA